MASSSYKNTYDLMFKRFGDLGWWPAETPEEVIIGAILTQNTSWKNVEKSLEKLRENELLSLRSIMKTDKKILSELIRSSGFFNQKADRLLRLSKAIISTYGNIDNMKILELDEVRDFLKEINGVGQETLDSILLYALCFPVFIVDKYTIRIFERVGIIDKTMSAENLKSSVENDLERNEKLLKNFHAMIIELGKNHCKKEPLCGACPLNTVCKHYKDRILP